MKKRILTGVKPTGTPHLGNYFGTLEPCIRGAKDSDESYLFVANYHALNQIQDGVTLEHNTISIAATWIACGLDLSHTYMYAQSDIIEDFELTTMLTAFTPKGWMNKMHAYKASVDKNLEANKHEDEDVSMGLYTYPILMAADILLYEATHVPVGKDQVQHVEIARDIGQRINAHFDQDLFVLPEHEIEEEVGTIVGTDGRKMSKSYDNVIALFASPEERQKQVNQIVTDSSLPEDKKEVVGTPIHDIYKLFASPDKLAQFTSDLEEGRMGWGDAKKQVSGDMDEFFGGMTAEYNRLMDNPDEVRQALHDGAEKVRPHAQALMERLRKTMGII